MVTVQVADLSHEVVTWCQVNFVNAFNANPIKWLSVSGEVYGGKLGKLRESNLADELQRFVTLNHGNATKSYHRMYCMDCAHLLMKWWCTCKSTRPPSELLPYVTLCHVMTRRGFWVGWQGNDGGREKYESVVTKSVGVTVTLLIFSYLRTLTVVARILPVRWWVA